MVVTQRSTVVSQGSMLAKTTTTRANAFDFIVNGVSSVVAVLSGPVNAFAIVVGAFGTVVTVFAPVVDAPGSFVKAFHLNGG
jgi:hypothetical protein